ncbi:DNA repair protein RecO [Hydrogenothermus marinus]|uniref:DNA repair protein RecO n=1 Tax=Hydrogenothermus marinus TaxID=133270 RepID=A0A3M0BNQ1_9AQUI|nr:DNA repair protein RecO [Hydrogenothermus marinus]RMA97919.1 DNA replication and repair protein RecO [Hydrogenothermus marinus]
MIFIKDEAIVLRKSEVGDKDLSITVYTKTLGKENIYVKGAQIIKHPFLPVLQPFNWFKGVLIRYKEKLYIKEIDKSYNLAYNYTKDLDKLKTAIWILETFDKYTLFPDKNMFTFLKKTLYFLSKTNNLENYKLSFVIKYIYLYGIFPMISKCIKCEIDINSSNFAKFSFKKRGSICKKCSKDKKTDLTYNQILDINKLLKKDLKEIDKINIKNPESLINKLTKYLESETSL